jgi:hypothetical protein
MSTNPNTSLRGSVTFVLTHRGVIPCSFYLPLMLGGMFFEASLQFSCIFSLFPFWYLFPRGRKVVLLLLISLTPPRAARCPLPPQVHPCRLLACRPAAPFARSRACIHAAHTRSPRFLHPLMPNLARSLCSTELGRYNRAHSQLYDTSQTYL